MEFDKNPFLSHINPERTLFCLCIGIHDYTTLTNDGMSVSPTRSKKADHSLKSIEEEDQMGGNELANSINFSDVEEKNQPSDSNFSSSKSGESMISQHKIFISHRVFCISSYYPFFSFYEEILRRLINIIKMERLTIYKHNNEDISETDSRFQHHKMIELFLDCIKDLNSRKVIFNRSYELKLINHEKIILLTDWNLAKTYFIE